MVIDVKVMNEGAEFQSVFLVFEWDANLYVPNAHRDTP